MMNKTKIEWTDYTANPIKGKCKMGCSYCYARKLYDRFKWNPQIKFRPECLSELYFIKKPSRIFLCSTHELFGEWIPDGWIREILLKLETMPNHTFQILTKCPARAKQFNFPNNVWFGVTMTGQESEKEQVERFEQLMSVKAEVHFVSFEPLFAMPVSLDWDNIDWAIIGAQTQPLVLPKSKWVNELIGHFWVRAIPVFMKNNLKRIMGKDFTQEFPK